MSTAARRAIVLFAHGSRDPLWHKPMEAVAQQIAQSHPNALVRCAYLELSTPDLATVCHGLADQGCRDIAVLPLFLGVGKHAREDLPLLIAGLRQQYPAVRFDLKPAVGEDPRLIQLLAGIAAE
jgi:sirohydrochlorin cobaltochelatase